MIEQKTFTHLEKAGAAEWDGLRLPARQRLAAACKHLNDSGKLQRADVMRLGEISQPQASVDIRAILERAPDFMEYDISRRCYVLKGSKADS